MFKNIYFKEEFIFMLTKHIITVQLSEFLFFFFNPTFNVVSKNNFKKVV